MSLKYFVKPLLLVAAISFLGACGTNAPKEKDPVKVTEKKKDKKKKKECRANPCQYIGEPCGAQMKGEDTYCYTGASSLSMKCFMLDEDGYTVDEEGNRLQSPGEAHYTYINDEGKEEPVAYPEKGRCLVPCSNIGAICGFEYTDESDQTKKWNYNADNNPVLQLTCIPPDSGTGDGSCEIKGHSN